MKSHEFEALRDPSNMACTRLVTDADGYGTPCGLPGHHPVHHAPPKPSESPLVDLLQSYTERIGAAQNTVVNAWVDLMTLDPKRRGVLVAYSGGLLTQVELSPDVPYGEIHQKDVP